VSSSASSRVAHLVDATLEASVVGSFTKVGPVVRNRLQHWEPCPPRPGRIVVITGASSGLGAEAARELAGLECTVVAVGRNQARLDEVARSIAAAGGTVETEQADLADLEETADLGRRLLSRFERIDVLVNNAGALLNDYTLGAQGHEITVTVHLLSPYLLTTLIQPAMEGAARAKVITMTSGGMYTEPFVLDKLEMRPDRYRGSVAYARAKRAQVVLTGAWQRHEPVDGRIFCAMHPGWAATPGVADSLPTFQRIVGPLLRSPAEGVDTLVWLSTLPPGDPEGGKLWLDRHVRSPYRLKKTRATHEEEVHQGDELLGWLAEVTAPFM
jgi:dehydrogenase/reductase SDR family member 12